MSFFELSPMGGMSMGGMYLGGAPRTAEQKAQMKANRNAKLREAIRRAGPDGDVITELEKLSVRKLSPEERLLKARLRIEDPEEYKRQFPRKARTVTGLQAKKKQLIDKLFTTGNKKRVPVGWSQSRKEMGYADGNKYGLQERMDYIDQVLAQAAEAGWGAEVEELVGSGLWDTLAKGIMTVAPMLI
jgi:hypothetical protein